MRIMRVLVWASCTIAVLQLLAGCSAHKSAYKKCNRNYVDGHYDAALPQCAKALRAKPDYPEAQSLIQDVFRAAVNAHEERISELKLSAGTFKWDDIVPEYEALIELNQAVENLPTLKGPQAGAIITFDTVDYAEELGEARREASEAHYEEGLRLGGITDPEAQRQAADHFEAALFFTPDFKDAAQRYARSKGAGIKIMAVIPFQDRSGKQGRYGAVTEMIADEVISDVMNDAYAREFLEVVSRARIEAALRDQGIKLADLADEETLIAVGNDLGVHGVLVGQVSQIIYNPPQTTTKSELQKKEVVIAEEKSTGKDGKEKVKEVWGEVHAAVTLFAKGASASISGSYKIIDVATGRLEKSESFTQPVEYACRWATFSGDERALDSETKALAEGGECTDPAEEELVGQAARDLSFPLADALREYAR